MKIILLSLALSALFHLGLTGQVAVNTDGSATDPSAIMDVKSTEKGLLIPRMNLEERNSIASPAEGLTLYNTTTGNIEFFDGSGWVAYGPHGIFYDQGIQFQIAFGGSSDDYCRSMAETEDGYVFAGFGNSFGAGQNDFQLFKILKNGNPDPGFGINGSISIGGPSNEFLYRMYETHDGGFIMVGYTYSYGAGNMDIYVVKVTSSGFPDPSFGNNGTFTIGGSNTDLGTDIIQSDDNGYIICGYTSSFGSGTNDFYVFKLTEAGVPDTQFGTNGTLVFGGPGSDLCVSADKCSDGCVILAGHTSSYGAGSSDLFLVKITQEGTLCNNFGNGGALVIGSPQEENSYKVINTADGGYLVSGFMVNSGTGVDALVVKLAADGTPDPGFFGNGVFALTAPGYEVFLDAQQHYDHSYYLVGRSNAMGSGNFDVLLVKLNDNGAVDTNFGVNGSLTFGGPQNDYANTLEFTADNGLIIAGFTNCYGSGLFDQYVIKLNQSGETCQSTAGGGTVVPVSFYSTSGGSASFGGVTGYGGTTGSGGILTLICN